MARSKSTSGGKTSRTSTTNEQSSAGIPANTMDVETKRVPEVKAGAPTTPAEAAAEVKVTPQAQATPEARVTPEPRKLEVVKHEPRKNVLPINLEEEIRRRAYELYQQRGSSAGSEAQDWLTAEREVRQRYRQQQSA
jgi:Protein of unknown function (DUF2934)